LSQSKTLIQHVLFKAKLWEKIQKASANPRQIRIINRMLDPDFKGFVHTSKYAKLAKCSTDTALRDIQDLVKKNILVQNPSKGRSTSYRLIDPKDLNQLP